MWLFCLRATARMLDVRYRVFILSGPGVMGSAWGLGLASGGKDRLVCEEDSGRVSLRARAGLVPVWAWGAGGGDRSLGVLLCSSLESSLVAVFWAPSSAQSRVFSPIPAWAQGRGQGPVAVVDAGAGPGGGGT